MNSAIDQAVAESCHDFVERLGKLNEEPYIREAIMKIAIREIAWAMLRTFDDQHALSDQLECMAEIIRDHKETPSETAA